MKKFFMPLALAMGVCLASCGGSGNQTTSDSTTTTTTSAGTEGSASTSTDASTGSSSSTAASGSSSRPTKEYYMDLSTNKRVKVQRDEASGRYLNSETHQPIDYYYDPETNDTFDVQGRVVNMALTRGAGGKYSVDESKIKVQGDDDLKMKSADGNTKVKLETDGDAKIKTDSSKIKVRDGKITEKKRS